MKFFSMMIRTGFQRFSPERVRRYKPELAGRASSCDIRQKAMNLQQEIKQIQVSERKS
jgi:hypothetical protein